MSELQIPSEQEIAKLPRWAQVAFAARCARRVQPLFSHAWPDAPPEHVEAIERAISISQASAASPTTVTESFPGFANFSAVSASAYARAAATHTRAVDRLTVKSADAAAHSADAAAHAADSAVSAARSADAPDANHNFYASVHTADATYALADAVTAAVNAIPASADPTKIAIRHDFDLLLSLVDRDGWTDDTPVPPEVFGPMWPDGEPEGWPEHLDHGEPLRLKVEIVAPAEMAEAQSAAYVERVAEFFARLSAAHVAMGGNGLRLIEGTSSAPVPELDEEPIGVGCGTGSGVGR